MSKKNKKVDLPQGKESKTSKPTIPKVQQPTEEQAFNSYISQVISNTILDMEGTKQRAVDGIKVLGQQLAMYMNEVKRLKAENEKLKKPKSG